MDIELKDMTQDDIEMVRNWRNSPDVARYMYTEDQITAEQQQRWFDKIKNDLTCRYWVIWYNEKPLGVASLMGINKELSSCYWAFYLGDVSVQGAGIGSKVEYNVLEYVFNELKLNKLRCEVLTFNDKVITMHEKFGFRREAFYRQHVKKEGKWQDAVGLAMLRDEWKNYREVMKAKIYR